MGRKTLFNPGTATSLLEAIKVGGTHLVACRYAGISHETLYTWLDRGRAGEAPFAAFAVSFDEAQGLAAVQALEDIKAASKKDWRASAWMLERRFPEEYGEKQHIKHSGEIELLQKLTQLPQMSTVEIEAFITDAQHFLSERAGE